MPGVHVTHSINLPDVVCGTARLSKPPLDPKRVESEKTVPNEIIMAGPEGKSKKNEMSRPT